jgi:ABC-type phosphate transport system substrate-binding protein
MDGLAPSLAPRPAITVVHRSDGSGTTYIFSNYLLIKAFDDYEKKAPAWR